MKIKKKFASFISFGLAAMVLTFGLAGCAGNTVVAQGWSGINGTGDKLIYVFTQPSTGGFLGCGAVPAKSQLVILSAIDGGKINTIDLGDSTISYGMPAISGNYAYITGYNGKVYRVDINSGGTPLAVYVNPDKPQAIVGGALIAENKVFVGCVDGKLYALDAGSLASIWSFATGNRIWSTPSTANGTVYIGSFDKSIYALDASNGSTKWSFATQGAVVATPIISGDRVYVASLDRHVYALDAASGNLIWQFPAETSSTNPQNWFWATPLVVDNEIFAPNMDGNVYIINTQDGSLVSEPINIGKSIASSPVIVDNRVLLTTEMGQIYSLDIMSKQPFLIKDLSAQIRAPLTVVKNLVYIHTLNTIYQYNPENNDPPKEIGISNSTATGTPSATVSTTVVTVTVTTTK